MRLGSGIGVEPCLVGFESGPIDKAGVMIPDENGPLIHGQVAGPLSDNALFIDIALISGLAVRVCASIHRIGQDLVERVIGGCDPTNRARQTGRCDLEWEGQAFGAEPEPNPPCRAKFGESFNLKRAAVIGGDQGSG